MRNETNCVTFVVVILNAKCTLFDRIFSLSLAILFPISLFTVLFMIKYEHLFLSLYNENAKNISNDKESPMNFIYFHFKEHTKTEQVRKRRNMLLYFSISRSLLSHHFQLPHTQIYAFYL